MDLTKVIVLLLTAAGVICLVIMEIPEETSAHRKTRVRTARPAGAQTSNLRDIIHFKPAAGELELPHR
jgi:hypothetical protein